ncbi:MAG: RrF2 family transcriptional regulator, partial [[Clostridium] scindens]|uniref:RrF2 family transcriptional regulator n=1 Tax=Clostridium scindens (strain JCM 10418 / VPI 12708) TaxID=29347 RepID=UPI003991FD52
MKISTKGIYALEIITDLAMHTENGALESIGNIARRRGLSVKYSERLIKELKDQGLVLSLRGAHGGYCLGRDAGEITVMYVLKAEEGELAPLECLTKETTCGID